MKRFILGLVISVIGVGVIHPMRRLAKVPKQFSSNFRPNVSMSMKRFFSLDEHSDKIWLQMAGLDKLSQNASAIKEDKVEVAQKLYALLNNKEYEFALASHNAKKYPKMIAGFAAGYALFQNTFLSGYPVLVAPFIAALEAGFFPAIFPLIGGGMCLFFSPVLIPCAVGVRSEFHNMDKKRAQRKLRRFIRDHLNNKNL